MCVVYLKLTELIVIYHAECGRYMHFGAAIIRLGCEDVGEKRESSFWGIVEGGSL